jgi:tRNA threonylcarbamoyl adenosine modification protein YeaZ
LSHHRQEAASSESFAYSDLSLHNDLQKQYDDIRRSKTSVLAVESAIGDGSISLLLSGDSVPITKAGGTVARVEGLLAGIDYVLKEASVESEVIDKIAVSVGPGSFTGLRIGISTALGLSTALGKPLIAVPLFDAIVYSIRPATRILIAVPIGRSDICIQLFEGLNAIDDPRMISEPEAADFIAGTMAEQLACHGGMVERLGDVSERSGIEVLDLGSNLADYIARYVEGGGRSGALDPIYVQNPRFV